MKRIHLIITLFALALLTGRAADLKVAGIFGDNMVLQQQSTVPVWGKADAGKTVKVHTSWNNRTYTTRADKDGAWKAMVTTPAYGGPYTLSVTSGKTVKFNNVYIGEVWLASGQSNMAMQLKECYESTPAILSAGKGNVRFINVPALGSYRPVDDIEAAWNVASPENAGESSAVAWYFGEFINRHTDIPVGIINASFGGSIVETWMSPETARAQGDIAVPEVCDATTGWQANIPTTMYNGMLHPIKGYGMRGCIWYQGESNVFNLEQYTRHLMAMVADWRSMWGNEFPFYYTQIAPFDYTTWNVPSNVGDHVGAYLRDSQRQCLDSIPNTGMAVILDLGELEQIHPVRKEKVGQRLALMALNDIYGKKGFEHRSPRFDSMEIDGNKAIIRFKDMGFGITSFGKPLTLFEIADDSRVFHPADAYVDEWNDVVVVSSKHVKEPKAVRYAFRNYVEPEIFSLSGLPASSFRTDNW